MCSLESIEITRTHTHTSTHTNTHTQTHTNTHTLTLTLTHTQVEQLRKVYEVLTGDMLLAAAFVSYAGPFTSKFRAGLIEDWIKFLKERQMPMTQGINDPLKVCEIVHVCACA